MEKEFVPYDESVALKELGFDLMPLSGWLHYKENPTHKPTLLLTDWEALESDDQIAVITNFNKEQNKNITSAPLTQQAFSWIRKKYGLINKIDQWYGEKFYVAIEDMNWPRKYSNALMREDGEYETYEEAEYACLKKLIVLAKTKPDREKEED